MDYRQALGYPHPENPAEAERLRDQLRQYLNLQLVAHGLPAAMSRTDQEFAALAEGLLAQHRTQSLLLDDYRCPVDQRIENFLNTHFADLNLTEPLRLPGVTLTLDRHGMARELSLPAHGNRYRSELLESHRVKNGVLHNPRADRRTTSGTFHVVEGGLPIPGDKKSVPRATFVKLFRVAMNPPESLLALPFASEEAEPALTFVSLLLRPLICPEVPGYCSYKNMEVRFLAPGNLVSNLDFVESIFGNAGDPYLPANDAALDVEHWCGHTGAVILAPHLNQLRKKDLDLPHVSQATERQKRDGMCWEHEDERYNDGSPCKITCRTAAGVIVTLITDNYYGYCKKEVKTQISYACNLYGGIEEEHAGGAIAFPSWSLGDEFQLDSQRYNGSAFQDVLDNYGAWIEVQEQGYGIDRRFPELIYLPEQARASVREGKISWTANGKEESIPLLPGKVYMAPSGYKLRLEKHPSARSWRLIGTAGEGTLCHKPCTVSGGGKSEISKSLVDYMHYGPVFVADFEKDMALIEEIFRRDYSQRWKTPPEHYAWRNSRPVLSPQRSLGSVIKLLTRSADYTDEFNAWLDGIPSHIYAMAFIIKRFYDPSWGDDWKSHFGVDIVNGEPGHELKFRDRNLVGLYLRVGFREPYQWRTFKLRQDFAAASKLQAEDDITASVVVPGRYLNHLASGPAETAYKFVQNCEYRLFQRPDEAIHRGFDRQTELDMAGGGNFFSNFEPLTRGKVAEMQEQVIAFDAFTPPMQRLLRSLEESDAEYVVCSANPRLVDGKPTKNPRYLQDTHDMSHPLTKYVAEMGARLFRKIPADQPTPLPVDAVVMGRRNNPPEKEAGIRSLAVYGPIHYQELPELFMDLICSLTGKSPSTTGAGSEGALTKGPFNALRPTADLNTALVSAILTGMAGYSTAAGHIGPNVRVDHDLSLLLPEIWCRLSPEQRDPNYLIREKMLEKLEDYTHNDQPVLASRLGYRITSKFVSTFFGRVFDNPGKVFDKAILKPESQDPDSYADGIRYIAESQRLVAWRYLQDGSVEEACPPLRALLHIMAEGSYEGKTAHDPEIRGMFTKEALLASSWYRRRLETKQQREIALWERHCDYLRTYLENRRHRPAREKLGLDDRLKLAESRLAHVRSREYLDELQGTLGADPLG